MAIREDKSISIEEIRGKRCINHDILPKGNADGCHADGASVVFVSPTFFRVLEEAFRCDELTLDDLP